MPFLSYFVIIYIMGVSDIIGLTITPRDISIILMVYHYDGLINSSIRRRFWPGFGRSSAFFERLSRLVDADYLRRKRLESPTGKGSGPSLITIGRRSHPILIEHLGLTTADLRRLRHAFIPLLWLHEAAIRDFRLTLELASESSSRVVLESWTNECDLRRSPIKVKVGTSAVELVPDGVFTLRMGDRSKSYWFELDRATETSPRRWKQQVKAYLYHVGQAPTPILVVVPHQQRAAQLSRWIEEAATEVGGSPGLFAIAESHRLDEWTVLHQPVWQVVGQERLTTLIPRPHDEAPRSAVPDRAGLPFGEELAGA